MTFEGVRAAASLADNVTWFIATTGSLRERPPYSHSASQEQGQEAGGAGLLRFPGEVLESSDRATTQERRVRLTKCGSSRVGWGCSFSYSHSAAALSFRLNTPLLCLCAPICLPYCERAALLISVSHIFMNLLL